MTTITIDKTQALKGCSKLIEPLNKLDAPIYVELKPSQIERSGQQITVKGRGWPDRRRQKRGDLIVTVIVVPDSKRKMSPSR